MYGITLTELEIKELLPEKELEKIDSPRKLFDYLVKLPEEKLQRLKIQKKK